MNKRNWSLVLFTCLSQASVGVILWLLLAHGLSSGTELALRTGLDAGNPALLALILMAIATLISFLHLGSPQNAPYSMTNLSGSWLSREILAINLYSVGLLVVFVLSWRVGTFAETGVWISLASLLGLALVWMMIRVYVIATIPSWNTWYTPLSFLCATICLGASVFFLLDYGDSVQIPAVVLRLLALTLIMVMLLELVSSMMHQARLQKMPGGLQKPDFHQGRYFKLHVLRMVLLILAIFGVNVLYLSGLPVHGGMGSLLLVVCLVLIICQEFLGRHLFYSSYFRIGF